MPSGKQLLLKTLQKYSQQRQTVNEQTNTSEIIRAVLCAHCSTSGETMRKILQIGWISENDEDGLVKQGLGIEQNNIFISDIFEEIIVDDAITERIKTRFPTLTQDQYSLALDMIWHILSSIQYWEELSSVENNGTMSPLEEKTLITSGKNTIKNYKLDPW